MTDAYAYRAFGAAWQGGNGSANAYRYAGEYGYYRDAYSSYFAKGQLLDSIWGRWTNLVNLWPDKHRAAVVYQYANNDPFANNSQSGETPFTGTRAGLIGIASCFKDIKCASCASHGKSTIRDQDCCLHSHQPPDKCWKNVWLDWQKYYGAYKLSDPSFNCFDEVKLHRLKFDKSLRRYIETGSSVTVTVVDSGHLQNTPKQGFPGLTRIIDLMPAAAGKLLLPDERKSGMMCNGFLHAIRAERVGHAFPVEARICWSSNCAQRSHHKNRPNSECS